MNSFINLCFDTVTHPSEGIRSVIYKTEVGDDVYNEYSTVNQLKDFTVELLGKEPFLFVSNRTMVNQICLKS